MWEILSGTRDVEARGRAPSRSRLRLRWTEASASRARRPHRCRLHGRPSRPGGCGSKVGSTAHARAKEAGMLRAHPLPLTPSAPLGQHAKLPSSTCRKWCARLSGSPRHRGSRSSLRASSNRRFGVKPRPRIGGLLSEAWRRFISRARSGAGGKRATDRSRRGEQECAASAQQPPTP